MKMDEVLCMTWIPESRREEGADPALAAALCGTQETWSNEIWVSGEGLKPPCHLATGVRDVDPTGPRILRRKTTLG